MQALLVPYVCLSVLASKSGCSGLLLHVRNLAKCACPGSCPPPSSSSSLSCSSWLGACLSDFCARLYPSTSLRLMPRFQCALFVYHRSIALFIIAAQTDFFLVFPQKQALKKKNKMLWFLSIGLWPHPCLHLITLSSDDWGLALLQHNLKTARTKSQPRISFKLTHFLVAET